MERRAEEERRRADATDGIVRATHEKFVSAYAERAIRLRGTPETGSELSG